jgi:hypothetical protein
MKFLRICGLLSLLSIAAFSRVPFALSDPGTPAADLSEYVHLHQTRSQGIALEIAAGADMCRGVTRAPRR